MRLSFLPLIVVEVAFSALFIIAFGFGNFLLFLLLSMLAGVALLALFWKNMLEFQMGSFKNMLTQFSFVIAGFLLLVPGVLSSLLGICVLVFALVFESTLKRKTPRNQNENEEIIDVEIIEDRR
ncbi:FxsA family membrane protein [Campylobacter sp.]|uniref:FxsA family membrane protein n=1 Tax=Campylobacter sp. TaxID=205 RepID=UPI0026DB7B5D|nr:FxsA family membrane protein [Campylobacter sp.]MDO4673755.1 FxsA family protein [Campylobacter sp.]